MRFCSSWVLTAVLVQGGLHVGHVAVQLADRASFWRLAAVSAACGLGLSLAGRGLGLLQLLLLVCCQAASFCCTAA